MRLLVWVSLITFAVDQVSKVFVLHGLGLMLRGSMDVLPPYLNLRMAWNTGINFGLFGGDASHARWVLIAIALAIVAFVLVWIWREKPGRFGMAAAGLLVGGALGNIVDRLVYGAVADFLNMSCCGFDNPFAFNVADVAIFAGALGLAFMPSGKKADKDTTKENPTDPA